jgi:hypothetical protein
MFKLPLVLSCVALEPSPEGSGGPLVLDCIVKDADGELVRAQGQLRINVNSKSDVEAVAAVLQGHANSTSKQLLAQGLAERPAVDDAQRAQDLNAILNQPFVGVSQ